ncbi:MAG: Trp biosynthesis-associated membrane protein, partial [Lapillicoccus sp.]
LAVAALGASVLTLLVVVDPAAAVSALVAERVGQSGRVATDAGVTFWVWPELAVGVVLSAVGLLAIPASGRWEGLSSRFERPDASATDPRGVRRTAWDELSEGTDPTDSTDSTEPTGSTEPMEPTEQARPAAIDESGASDDAREPRA